MSDQEPNENLLELTMTKFCTSLQEGETLPSTRSDSGTSPGTTGLPGHREAERAEKTSETPAPSLQLEIQGDNGQKAVAVAVSLKNLYSGMVVLEVNSFGVSKDPETLQGNQAVLRVRTAENEESISINGIMTWTYNQTRRAININLRMPEAHPNKRVTKILESFLPAASKELKGFWNMWDKTQTNQEAL